MEFSYRISEEDYLRACRIKVKSIATLRPWWFKSAYRLLLFLFVWSAFSLGLQFGWSDAADSQHGVSMLPISRVLVEALLPAFGISFLYFLFLGALHPFLVRKASAELEHYRSDPSCRCQTTLTITSDKVLFCCGNGCLTQSGWNIYDHWVESGDILLLVTLARARRIVHLGGLSDGEREELRGILRAALPDKK